MQFTPAPGHKIHAVSLLIFQQEKFLLISRAKAPFAGWLSFPGGKVEVGETAKAAARRELREETGLEAQHFEHLITLDLAKEGEAAQHYFLSVYHGQHISGEAKAGDDASALCYLSLAQMEEAQARIIPSVLAVARHFFQIHAMT